MFLECIRNSGNLIKGKVYEGVKVNGVTNKLIGYYLYCIGVVRDVESLVEVDYKDAMAVNNIEGLAEGSKYRAIKIVEPITNTDVWKVEGLDKEFSENTLIYCRKEMLEKDGELFTDVINKMKDGDKYTCGDWHIEKIDETYKFVSPDGVEIDVSALTMWRKEEIDTVDFIDAYKHLEDGGSAVSVLSGVKYSFEDIDKNDYQEIDIDEIKNKWRLV